MQDFGIAIYKEYAKMNRAVICGPVFLFNRKIRPIEQKNAPLRIALRREGIMSPGRPAAGGESRRRDSLSFLCRILFSRKVHIHDKGGE